MLRQQNIVLLTWTWARPKEKKPIVRTQLVPELHLLKRYAIQILSFGISFKVYLQRRKLEELPYNEQPLEDPPCELNSAKTDEQDMLQELLDSGQEPDDQTIDAVINDELMAVPSSDKEAAAEIDGGESDDHEGELSAQTGPEEPDESEFSQYYSKIEAN